MDTIVINDLFSAIFNVLYFAVILATIFIVILDNRNPVKTMAWILVLFFLPIVGLVFYFKQVRIKHRFLSIPSVNIDPGKQA